METSAAIGYIYLSRFWEEFHALRPTFRLHRFAAGRVRARVRARPLHRALESGRQPAECDVRLHQSGSEQSPRHPARAAADVLNDMRSWRLTRRAGAALLAMAAYLAVTVPRLGVFPPVGEDEPWIAAAPYKLATQ